MYAATNAVKVLEVKAEMKAATKASSRLSYMLGCSRIKGYIELHVRMVVRDTWELKTVRSLKAQWL